MAENPASSHTCRNLECPWFLPTTKYPALSLSPYVRPSLWSTPPTTTTPASLPKSKKSRQSLLQVVLLLKSKEVKIPSLASGLSCVPPVSFFQTESALRYIERLYILGSLRAVNIYFFVCDRTQEGRMGKT